jgi:hypothetical protein
MMKGYFGLADAEITEVKDVTVAEHTVLGQEL